MRRVALLRTVALVGTKSPDPKAPTLKQSPSPFATTVGQDKVNELSKHLDRLPSTIPGVSQQELAEKIRKYTEHNDQLDKARFQAKREALLAERKVSMRPEDYITFVAELNTKEAQALKEAQQQASMTPFEYQRFYEKKIRRKNISQTFWVAVYFTLPYGVLLFLWLWWTRFFH